MTTFQQAESESLQELQDSLDRYAAEYEAEQHHAFQHVGDGTVEGAILSEQESRHEDW